MGMLLRLKEPLTLPLRGVKVLTHCLWEKPERNACSKGAFRTARYSDYYVLKNNPLLLDIGDAVIAFPYYVFTGKISSILTLRGRGTLA